MAVKPSQSAGRVLKVFDFVARMQPVTLTALAKASGVNLSALQRDLLTLSEAGWVQQLASDGKSWELTHHIMTMARTPYSSRAVRSQIRPIMERLYELVGEAVYFTAPHHNNFVVIDAIERPDAMRIVPPLGVVVPGEDSATGQAFLAALHPERRESRLGEPLSAEIKTKLTDILSCGYAVSDGHVIPGIVTLAAAVSENECQPVGALVVTGPAERLTPDVRAQIGSHLRNAAMSASELLHNELLTRNGQHHLPKTAGLTL